MQRQRKRQPFCRFCTRHKLALWPKRGITHCQGPPASSPTKRGGCLSHCSTFVYPGPADGQRQHSCGSRPPPGLSLCIPHDCALCGAQVDETGVHALSCHKSKGRLPHHSYLNDIIKRALTAIGIPCAFEPRGLCK